jgi:predicted nucleic acid-binding protein
MVVLDATMLMALFRPDAGGPTDSKGKPIDDAKERIEHFVKQLEAAKTKIIVPTPALSEILVRAGAAESQQIIEEINRSAVFRIEPFDTRAAIEVAAMTRTALSDGGKKATSRSPWAKVKYDRQIVAIAKVAQATAIYSDDSDVRSIAKAVGIPVIGFSQLPLPPETAQKELPFKPPPEDPNDVDIEEELKQAIEEPKPPDSK